MSRNRISRDVGEVAIEWLLELLIVVAVILLVAST